MNSKQHLADTLDGLNHAWKEFQHKNDERLKQIEEKGSADPLLLKTLDRINHSLEQTNYKIEMMETKKKRPNYSNTFEDREYKKAFNNFLKFGETQVIKQMQQKKLSINDMNFSNNNGGYLIRPEMSEYIDLYNQDNEILFDLVDKEYSTYNHVKCIIDDDSIKANWNADGMEFASNSDTNHAHFSAIEIQKGMMCCRIKVNANIINDPIIDLEKYIVDVAARAFSKLRTLGILFGKLTTGSGITSEQASDVGDILSGISTKFQNTLNSAQSNEMLVGGSLSASQTLANITYADILNTYYKLDNKYIKNASFVMSSATLTHLRTLKDAQNNYLWSPANTNFSQDNIMGIPIYRIDAMDNIDNQSTAGKYKRNYLYLGDFKRAYRLFLNPNIEIIRDPFSNQPSVNFLITQYIGGAIIDKKAIVALGNQQKTT